MVSISHLVHSETEIAPLLLGTMPLQNSYRLAGRPEPLHFTHNQGISRFDRGDNKGVTMKGRPVSSMHSSRQRRDFRCSQKTIAEPYTLRAPFASEYRPKTHEAGVASRVNASGKFGPHKFGRIDEQNSIIKSLKTELSMLRAMPTPSHPRMGTPLAHGGRVTMVEPRALSSAGSTGSYRQQQFQ